MKQVMFVGDTHADLFRTYRILDEAHRRGIDTIFQAGDFGFWPNINGGSFFLNGISNRAVELGIEVHWVDGNHEDHWSLESLTLDAHEPIEYHPNLIWHPRGSTQTFNGIKFLFFGGAVSIDKGYRTLGVDWFPDEVPSNAQIMKALEATKVDVVLSHEAPLSVDLQGHFRGIASDGVRRDAVNFRRYLEMIREELQPATWVHGHWHVRQDTEVGTTTVYSLGDNTGELRDQFIVLPLS